MTVPSAPIISGITVTLMFHRFSNPLARCWYLSYFLPFFSSTLRSTGTAMYTIPQILFFCWLSLGLIVWPRLNHPFVSKNPRELCASHFLGQILGCIYTICSYYYYYYYYYYFTNREIYPPALAIGLLLESETQQVPFRLLDSSQYSSRSWLSCSLSGLDFSSDFQFFQACQWQLTSSSPSHSTTFLVLWQGHCTCIYFLFLRFSLCGPLGRQCPQYIRFAFFLVFFLFIISKWVTDPRPNELSG